ncbi:MAG: hypothetical protein LBM62_06080 [Mediterranea sp.]|jgi:hypothetical protein|nr:hypothetical protein [Mediterranea sp.]
MKTKVFLATLAVAFSLSITSCGGKKAGDNTVADTKAATEECCAAEGEKACCDADTTKACCQEEAGEQK